MTARLSAVNHIYKQICRTERKNPRIGPHEQRKTRLRQGCKRVERPCNMVSIGIFETCTSVPAYRDGYRVEVYVNDGSIIVIVIHASVMARPHMDVLVWRHNKRRQQSEAHRKHRHLTHGPDYAQVVLAIQTVLQGKSGKKGVYLTITYQKSAASEYRAYCAASVFAMLWKPIERGAALLFGSDSH